MKINYTIRNSETRKVYVDKIKTFNTAVKAARTIVNQPLEIVKTTTEVIKKYDL